MKFTKFELPVEVHTENELHFIGFTCPRCSVSSTLISQELEYLTCNAGKCNQGCNFFIREGIAIGNYSDKPMLSEGAATIKNLSNQISYYNFYGVEPTWDSFPKELKSPFIKDLMGKLYTHTVYASKVGNGQDMRLDKFKEGLKKANYLTTVNADRNNRIMLAMADTESGDGSRNFKDTWQMGNFNG